jgi:hypothetical protein
METLFNRLSLQSLNKLRVFLLLYLNLYLCIWTIFFFYLSKNNYLKSNIVLKF